MHDVILNISDMHHPYAHPDTIAFLRAIKKKYLDKAKRPLVVIGGDEQDGHAISFHDRDPDLMAPGDELQTAINRMQPLYKLFPKAIVLESNHGSLVYRKQKAHGLPRFVIKSYREVLGAPKGWKWVPELTVKASDGHPIYFCHGKVSQVIRLSQIMGMRCVQFHYHENFSIQYWANPLGLQWALQSGCLIDDDSLAFSYNKLNSKRPVIGTSVIINGHPKLIPLVMDKNGRWIGKLV